MTHFKARNLTALLLVLILLVSMFSTSASRILKQNRKSSSRENPLKNSQKQKNPAKKFQKLKNPRKFQTHPPPARFRAAISSGN